ncbi:hypothetical protein L210DRAFT_3655993 [Boletus edulis BED1]|uniref:Uncharacterized protein n=1 Tax=Boletus edulis BED1 TaxID=1328754 RepID=A0AAD4BCI2_BOLED|nr:hypothetical protein L210DRAFT_3655993 [Boletus edulis BED1]
MYAQNPLKGGEYLKQRPFVELLSPRSRIPKAHSPPGLPKFHLATQTTVKVGPPRGVHKRQLVCAPGTNTAPTAPSMSIVHSPEVPLREPSIRHPGVIASQKTPPFHQRQNTAAKQPAQALSASMATNAAASIQPEGPKPDVTGIISAKVEELKQLHCTISIAAIETLNSLQPSSKR